MGLLFRCRAGDHTIMVAGDWSKRDIPAVYCDLHECWMEDPEERELKLKTNDKN